MDIATAPASKVWRKCGRCAGRGRVAGTRVAAGVCFACQGDGRVLDAADWQARERRADARRKATNARRAAAGANARLWAAFTAAHPDEAALIEAHRDEYGHPLSHAYAAVATYDERDSDAAAALAWVRAVA